MKSFLQIEIPLEKLTDEQREQLIGDVFRMIDVHPIGQFDMQIVHYEDIGETEIVDDE